MDIANPIVIERAYKKLSFEEWPASVASAASDFDETADATTCLYSTPGSFHGSSSLNGVMPSIVSDKYGNFVVIDPTVHLDQLTDLVEFSDFVALQADVAVCITNALDADISLAEYETIEFDSDGGIQIASSANQQEIFSRAECADLIEQLEEISSSSAWSLLANRLSDLLEASYDPEEGSAPMQASSLVTLRELVHRAPQLKRPAITLTRNGRIWLEWMISEKERAAAECLPEGTLHIAWIRPDRRGGSAFARRYATISVDEFVSEEFASSSVWQKISRPE